MSERTVPLLSKLSANSRFAWIIVYVLQTLAAYANWKEWGIINRLSSIAAIFLCRPVAVSAIARPLKSILEQIGNVARKNHQPNCTGTHFFPADHARVVSFTTVWT